MEIGLAGHLPKREVELKAIRDMVEQPIQGQYHILTGQKEASVAGRAVGWKHHLLAPFQLCTENMPACLPPAVAAGSERRQEISVIT